MARRKSRKLKPVETITNFIIPEAGTYYMDLSQIYSQVNRHALRQGWEWGIQDIELFNVLDPAADSATVNVYRLPQGWSSSNAWVKAFSAWRTQQQDAMDDAQMDSLQGKYNDFKVFFDANHALGSVDADTGIWDSNLWPAGFTTPAVAFGLDPNVTYDWDYSQFVLPQATGLTEETYGHMVGNDTPDGTTSRGLIHNYALSRSRPHGFDPNTVAIIGESTGLYGEMEDVGQDMDEIIDNVAYSNNEPPYVISEDSTYEWYPGGAGNSESTWVTALQVRGGSTVSSDHSGPFTAYCGLLRLDVDGACILKLTVASGATKGYMARPMQDVN